MLSTLTAAVPAAALSSASIADPHPDAELLALGRQIEEAYAAYCAADARADELRAKFYKQCPARPDALEWRSSDETMGLLVVRGEHYTKDDVELLRSLRFTRTYARAASRECAADESILGATEDGQIVTCEAMDRLRQSRRNAIIAASDEFHPIEETLRRDLGLDSAEDEEEATSSRLTALEHTLAATPAATIDGLRLKAQVAQRGLIAEGEDMHEAGVWSHQVTWSIVRDLLALPVSTVS